MNDQEVRADINFYFDPLCPFAWMISKWVRIVTEQRDYTVDWRFISLRMLNSHIDYDAHFPAGYEAGHTAGLRLLRDAAKARTEHGRAAVGPLYAAIGARAFDTAPEPAQADPRYLGTPAFLEPALAEAGLPIGVYLVNGTSLCQTAGDREVPFSGTPSCTSAARSAVTAPRSTSSTTCPTR